MLNGKLALHDVDDAERFTRQVIDRTASKHCLGWSEDKREELLADSIAHLWELSVRYQPGVGTFSGYARRFLRFYVIDWIRYREGRTRFQFGPQQGPERKHIPMGLKSSGGVYERPRREVLTLDDQLAESLGSRRLDPAAHSESDFRGALARGDSPEAWAAAAEDLEDAGGSERRAA